MNENSCATLGGQSPLDQPQTPFLNMVNNLLVMKIN